MGNGAPDQAPEDPPHTEDRAYRPGALAEVLRILEEFHARIDADRAAGRKPTLSEYLAQFPGHEDVIREDWRRLREEDPPVRVAASPMRILEALLRSGTRRLDASREIARGGMGVVYRTRDEVFGRDLALKLGENARIPLGGEATISVGSALRRMLQEAQITAQLSHPGVIPVHEMGIDREGRLFFTMKLVRGRTLRDVFALVREGREGWTTTRALQVLIRICETVAFAHSKGVIHRDLKPANVMVGAFGEVYVMDWGVAKVVGDPSAEDPLSVVVSPVTSAEASEPVPLTRAGDVVGTPEYMSPEQASGRIDAMDPRTDVYSLGALLYELLAARAPYEDPTTPRTPIGILRNVIGGPPTPLSAVAPRVPEELKAVCAKAMARDPGDRYPTAEALANDLHRYLEGRVVLAHRTGPLVEFRTWVRRNSAVAGTAAAAMAVLVSAGAWFTVERSRDAEVVRGERDAARTAQAKEKRASRRARGLLLAARSAALVPKDPALALQLAVKAAELAPGSDATDALHAALARHHERRRLVGHDSYVVEGSWSADGSRVLTREWGDVVILWDAATGRPVARMLADDEVLGAALSPDRYVVAAVGRGGFARLWDANRGSVLRTLAGHEGPVRPLEFSPDGGRLATGGDDGTVRIWPVEGSEPALVLRGGGGGIADVAWLPGGRQVLSIEFDGSVRLFDARSGEVLRTIQEPGKAAARDLPKLFLADGGRLLGTWSEQSLFRLYALEDGAPRLLAERRHAARPVLSGDGRRIGVPQRAREEDPAVLELFDAADPGSPRSIPLDPFTPLMALDREARRAAVAHNYEVRVLDLEEGRVLATLLGHRYDLKGLAWSPDGRRLLSVSADMTARLWDPGLPDTRPLPKAPAWGSPDGTRAVAPEGPAEGGSIPMVITDPAGGGAPVRFRAPAPLSYVQWLDDGSHVLALGEDRLVVVDARTGATVGATRLPGDVVGQGPRVETSLDLRRACIPDGTGHLVVAELATGKHLPHRIPSRVNCAISPDGSRIVTAGGGSMSATIWDADTGQKVRDLTGHTGWVICVNFSPDGERISTSAMEGKVRVWDARTGEPVAIVGPVPMRGNFARFGEGHRWLAVETGPEVLLFPGDGGDRVATLAPPAPRPGRTVAGPFLAGTGAIALVAGEPPAVRLWPLDPLPVAQERLPIEAEPSTVRAHELLAGKEADAYEESWLRQHPTGRSFALRGVALARKGDLVGAMQWVEAARILTPRHVDVTFGEACVRAARVRPMDPGPARAEEADRAFAALARCFEQDPGRASHARNEPLLEPLRSDPRWGPMVKE
jgi:WD40 repeat protein